MLTHLQLDPSQVLLVLEETLVQSALDWDSANCSTVLPS
jgi:hypothetical protein